MYSKIIILKLHTLPRIVLSSSIFIINVIRFLLFYIRVITIAQLAELAIVEVVGLNF